MEQVKIRPFEDWVLYITNHFTHLVVEAQAASPRYHLARKLSEKGQKLLVYCPIGRHVGNPFRDFVTNLFPRRTVSGNTVYLFPPVIVSPASITTPLTLIMGTLFILIYLTMTRLKVAAQYSTTILVGSVGAVIRMRKKINLVANYGDPDFAREHGLARKAFKFCEDLVMTKRNAHAIVYVDEVVGRYIVNNFPLNNTRFLPNGGYDAGFIPPSTESQEVIALKKRLGLEGKSVILYAGQLTLVYRLDVLVEAAPYIISQVPNARFLVIGSGPTLPLLRKSVKLAQLEDYFIFTGSVEYVALSPYLMLSDLCVQLLNDWCMGTKVVMYMVHRRAIVSGGGWFDQYGEFLKNGENSILIPSNAETFGKEAARLLKDPEKRVRLGESAWKSVSPYTWDNHADETLTLLKESTSRN
jgi:glycosyltransferase involved in cell wall biosynthesis